LDLGGRVAPLGRALLTAARGSAAAAAGSSQSGGGLRICIVFLLLLALSAAPVVSTVLPPLLDYPNHLARMHLLAAGGDPFYAVRWAPLPNLAEDLIVPPLARWMPLETAGKLFIVAIFALIAGGVLSLNRVATGGWRLWPLAAFLLLYNRTFLWGFLNYLFGLGAALFGLGLWLALEDRRAWLRVLAGAITALVCFFSHLAAFGVYALAICGVELPRIAADLSAGRWPALGRNTAILAAPFLIPAALVLCWQGQSGDSGISYAGFPRKLDLLFSVFDNYHRGFDIASFALVAGLLIWLGWTRRLGLTPPLGSAAGLLFVAYLALPTQIYGGSGLDHRLPLACFLLLIAGSAPRFPSRRAAASVGTAAALLLALRLAAIEHVWLRADRIYSVDLAGIDRLPRGVRLAVAYPEGAVHVAAVPEVHLAAMAVVRRDAFVPTLFAAAGQQPLVLRPVWAAIAAAAQPPRVWAALTGAVPPPALPALAPFEAVALVGRGPVHEPPGCRLRPFLAAPSFRIFAVRCDAAGRG
jgi:hypothetical protein